MRKQYNPWRYFCLAFAIGFLLVASPLLAQNSVVTYHNDNLRTGLNPNETILTTTNVNQITFGKLFSQAVDGQVYAQPLYVPNLTVGGVVHNVVFVVTEHDSAYAFDADNNTGVNANPLWHVSFINPGAGVTTVAQADVNNCSQITPEIGITDTPVIDLSTNTLYFVAFTKETSGATTTFVHRLHALDIVTGIEKFNGPVVIQASVTGSAAGDTFVPQAYKERCALLLVNGIVYTSWASHCDFNNWGTYHGWLISYNASNLQQQKAVFNSCPNGSEASFWNSDDGPAADANGNIYHLTGNGTFDADTGGVDYGDSFLKFSVSGGGALSVSDYFTPHNQASLSSADNDVGSVGGTLLPDSFGTAGHPHLMTGADKTGQVYLVDRDNMGKYSAAADTCLQSFHATTGTSNQAFTTAACYNDGTNNYIYWGFQGQSMKAFTFSNAQYNITFSSQTGTSFGSHGCVPSVSSNGTSNGIVWAIQSGNPAILHAYNATTLATELYNTSQAAGTRDSTGGNYVKFSLPTIINGKVFVPTSSGLAVYGLLSGLTATFTPTQTNSPGSPTATFTSTWTPTFTGTSTLTATRTPTSSTTKTPSTTPTRTPTNSPSSTPTNSPSISPTSTPSKSSTSTYTVTLTPTNSPSKTPTVTPTSSPTITPTNSVTKTPTGTPTNTGIPTLTFTVTFTLTTSNTPTPSPSSTPTKTPTNSPSRTPTSTSTNSATLTSTSTFTASSTLSPTQTSTLTPTNTPTLTPTNTATSTASNSPTRTATQTLTSTPSNSPTSTDSMTFSPTQTSTASLTNTPTLTLTNTATSTASNSPTRTATQTLTSTPSNSPTITDTEALSPTFSFTSSPTATTTPSFTYTLSPTFTASETSTVFFTSTATASSTWTATFTLTSTATNTMTSTKTASLTPSDTPTFTATSTVTLSPTPSPSVITTATSVPTIVGTCPPMVVLSPYPNPARDVPVHLGLETACFLHVEWTVFTHSFRKINGGELDVMGSGSLIWDLKDKSGTEVSNGVYYIRVKAEGNKTVVRKVLVLK